MLYFCEMGLIIFAGAAGVIEQKVAQRGPGAMTIKCCIEMRRDYQKYPTRPKRA